MQNVYGNEIDRIGLLETSTLKQSLNTYRSGSYGSSRPRTSRKNASDIGSTVHYLSPASSIARTENEGDLLYQHFEQFEQAPQMQFSDYKSSSASSISCEEAKMQRTLAFIKPDAMEYKDVILRAINTSGLIILSERTVHLTPEQVSEIYEKHYGSPLFPQMVVSVSVDPIFVVSLTGLNAVEKWKSMVGPYRILREEWFYPFSVRTRFGYHEEMAEMLHASDNLHEACKENRFFFPKSVLEPITCDLEKVVDYLELYVNKTLTQGLTKLVRVKPIDPVLYLAEWLLLHNPFQPRFPHTVAVTPT